MPICRPCDRGRRYCVGCAPVAEQERLKRARGKYRHSPEGKAQHAAEEQKRKAGLRRGVGDRCSDDTKCLGSVRAVEVAPVPKPRATDPIKKEETGGLMPVVAEAPEVSVPVGSTVASPVELPAVGAIPAVPAAAAVAGEKPPATPALPGPVEVTLVFPWRLRAAARAMLGTFVACGTCGRGGVVVRLVPTRTTRRRR